MEHIPQFYGGGMVKTVYDDAVIYLPAPDLYEAGSPNYPGVVGMLKAMKILKCIGFDYIKNHEQVLLRRTLDGLKKLPGIILYGDNENIADRVGIIVFNVKNINNEIVADYLANHHAIAVRHAAFCAHPYVRRLTKVKNVDLTSCQSPEGMVRISFGIYSDEADVDAFLKAIKILLFGEHLRGQIINEMTTTLLPGKPYDRG